MNEHLQNQKNNCSSVLIPYLNAARESIELSMSELEKAKICEALASIKYELESFMGTMDQIDAILQKMECK